MLQKPTEKQRGKQPLNRRDKKPPAQHRAFRAHVRVKTSRLGQVLRGEGSNQASTSNYSVNEQATNPALDDDAQIFSYKDVKFAGFLLCSIMLQKTTKVRRGEQPFSRNVS